MPGRSALRIRLDEDRLPSALSKTSSMVMGNFRRGLDQAQGDFAGSCAGSFVVAHPASRAYSSAILRRMAGVFDLGLGEAVLLQALGDQVLAPDGELLLTGVAGELDDLHPVQQGRGIVSVVLAGDEEHLLTRRGCRGRCHGRRSSARVEDLQQGAGRVSLVADAHLVDFVDEEDGVLRLAILSP